MTLADLNQAMLQCDALGDNREAYAITARIRAQLEAMTAGEVKLLARQCDVPRITKLEAINAICRKINRTQRAYDLIRV